MRARLFLRCLSLLVLCAVLAGWTGAYTDVRATETADTEDLEQQKKDREIAFKLVQCFKTEKKS